MRTVLPEYELQKTLWMIAHGEWGQVLQSHIAMYLPSYLVSYCKT